MLQRLTDKNTIRRILNTNRHWALYALADLDDGMFEQSEWWGCGNSLALVFHGISIRPIFVMGDSVNVRELLSALPLESGYLNLPIDNVAAADGIFTYRQRHEMCRMILQEFVPRIGETNRLSMNDCPEVEALFASGNGAGIAFAPAQLATGVFRGIRENGELIAVAGAHVVSVQEGVVGVGNVFVREDRRCRGLAQVVLSATVEAVRSKGIQTVGLNVACENATAIHAYEKLGFRTQFHYYEGTAERATAP